MIPTFSFPVPVVLQIRCARVPSSRQRNDPSGLVIISWSSRPGHIANPFHLHHSSFRRRPLVWSIDNAHHISHDDSHKVLAFPSQTLTREPLAITRQLRRFGLSWIF